MAESFTGKKYSSEPPSSPPQLITTELLLASSKQPVGKGESEDHFLSRVTHLHLNGKKLRAIGNLGVTRKLKVLYLYDNEIQRIESLDSLRELTQLHLQNNDIDVIENMSSLTSLTKLFLEGNHISKLEGLQTCTQLEELYLSGQRVPRGWTMGFDLTTLKSLAGSLTVLNLSNSNVQGCKALVTLQSLVRLDLSRNLIDDIQEIEPILRFLSKLRELDTRENPVCKSVERYKERTITLSHDPLMILDGKEIDSKQRSMMQTWEAHKAMRRRSEAMMRSNAEKTKFEEAEPQTVEKIGFTKRGKTPETIAGLPRLPQRRLPILQRRKSSGWRDKERSRSASMDESNNNMNDLLSISAANAKGTLK